LLSDLKIAGCTDLPDEREVWVARKKIVEYVPGADVCVQPQDVIHCFCNTLHASDGVRRVASYIHERLQSLGLTFNIKRWQCKLIIVAVEGKTPATIAAGCILLACEALDEAVDRDAVSALAQIAPTTLHNFCKIGKRNWGMIVPTEAELALFK
jgi:transcription initiation factor TFIIIB Brf1 subunit/transcription initiation factor TFIIB